MGTVSNGDLRKKDSGWPFRAGMENKKKNIVGSPGSLEGRGMGNPQYFFFVSISGRYTAIDVSRQKKAQRGEGDVWASCLVPEDLLIIINSYVGTPTYYMWLFRLQLVPIVALITNST